MHLKKPILLAASLFLAGASHASIVTLSVGFAGPFAEKSDGTPVDGGLMRIGTLNTTPASSDVADIDLAFAEFGTLFTGTTGRVGGTVSNGMASEFNTDQIYIWVFDAPTQEAATEHGLFTLTNPDMPENGNPWRFPVHTGAGTDSNTISMSDLRNGLDPSFTPGIESVQGNLRLTVIPEPSLPLLLGLGTLVFSLRRKR